MFFWLQTYIIANANVDMPGGEERMLPFIAPSGDIVNVLSGSLESLVVDDNVIGNETEVSESPDIAVLSFADKDVATDTLDPLGSVRNGGNGV